MFAIDHAATALLIERRYPAASLAPLLIAVQAMELVWVALNYAGVEHTTTEPVVRSVADIHLASMPYSRSVATAAGTALLVWLVVEKGFARPVLGRALGLGIVSHLVLDLGTHAPDSDDHRRADRGHSRAHLSARRALERSAACCENTVMKDGPANPP
jgi:hypothetical protein